jgi:hypothetical protein
MRNSIKLLFLATSVVTVFATGCGGSGALDPPPTTLPTPTTSISSKTDADEPLTLNLGDTTVLIVLPSGYASSRTSASEVDLANRNLYVNLFLTQLAAGITATDAQQSESAVGLSSTKYSQVKRGAVTDLTRIGSLAIVLQGYSAVWTATGSTTGSNESGFFMTGVKADGVALHLMVYGKPGAIEADQSWGTLYRQVYADFAKKL